MRFRLTYIVILCLLFYHLVRIYRLIVKTGLFQDSGVQVTTTERYKIKLLLDYNYKTKEFDSNSSDSDGQTKVILLFNEEKRRMAPIKEFQAYQSSCRYTNCIFTREKSKLQTADAVIFTVGTRNERMGENPPISGQFRNPNQVWIFTSFDPPFNYYNTDYQLPAWDNTMNWSMLYRLDSDIPNPFGTLLTRNVIPEKDYDAIFNSKTKHALWLVSQCQSISARRQYINVMTLKYDFDVDMLGDCGVDGNKISPEDMEQLIPQYKFYLAFEKALCNDFVTEKLFRNYNHDWILVVRGGSEYSRLFPTGTFINTADFPNISSVVDYLSKLGNNKEEYIKILREKDRYRSVLNDQGSAHCELCTRLNNLSKYQKTYTNTDNYLNDGQCQRARDI